MPGPILQHDNDTLAHVAPKLKAGPLPPSLLLPPRAAAMVRDEACRPHIRSNRGARREGGAGGGGLRWSPCDDDCDRSSSRLWLWRCGAWGRARRTASSCTPPGTCPRQRGRPRGCCRRHPPDHYHSMTRQDGAQDLVRVMALTMAAQWQGLAVSWRLGSGGVQRHCRTQSARTQRG